MKTRQIYSTDSVASAQRAVQAAREAGIDDANISLIARSDIELDRVPEHQKDASTDFKHAALRGAGYGSATGLLAGLVAMIVPPLGITIAGVALTTLGGAAVGTWASSMVGASLPDPVRRKFENEIESGRVLVVVDAEDDTLAAADHAMQQAGATHLSYEDPSAMT